MMRRFVNFLGRPWSGLWMGSGLLLGLIGVLVGRSRLGGCIRYGWQLSGYWLDVLTLGIIGLLALAYLGTIVVPLLRRDGMRMALRLILAPFVYGASLAILVFWAAFCAGGAYGWPTDVVYSPKHGRYYFLAQSIAFRNASQPIFSAASTRWNPIWTVEFYEESFCPDCCHERVGPDRPRLILSEDEELLVLQGGGQLLMDAYDLERGRVLVRATTRTWPEIDRWRSDVIQDLLDAHSRAVEARERFTAQTAHAAVDELCERVAADLNDNVLSDRWAAECAPVDVEMDLPDVAFVLLVTCRSSGSSIQYRSPLRLIDLRGRLYWTPPAISIEWPDEDDARSDDDESEPLIPHHRFLQVVRQALVGMAED